ncbi:MAG: transposase [Planctomycetota bacterium]|jgi:hypothetical protein
MARRVVENTGQAPEVLTADAGYWSKDGVSAVQALESRPLVATRAGRRTERGRPTGIGPPPAPLTDKEWMTWHLDMEPNRAIYRKRKSTVEPVFGQIKEVRGFRQFSFRGLVAVSQEWDLICTVHNLLKLFRHSMTLARAG